ncbi:MAG: hypothetical protein U9O87_09035 [Verrucomicrobiota bacterium]|nr:hypothetical protein [Verrucomicrobiota bacterium]
MEKFVGILIIWAVMGFVNLMIKGVKQYRETQPKTSTPQGQNNPSQPISPRSKKKVSTLSKLSPEQLKEFSEFVQRTTGKKLPQTEPPTPRKEPLANTKRQVTSAYYEDEYAEQQEENKKAYYEDEYAKQERENLSAYEDKSPQKKNDYILDIKSKTSLRKGIIAREIFGKPLALR